MQTFRTLPSFRLHMLARLSERFYEQFYRREFDLSLLECRIIGISGAFRQVSFKRVCEEANLDKSHASRLVDRLIRRKLLQKVSNPSDQRSVLIALTPAGRECEQQMHASASRFGEEWLSVLGADGRKVFQSALLKLEDQIRAMNRKMEDALNGRKARAGKRPRTQPASTAEPSFPEVVVNRKMARQLYELLGTALGPEPGVTPGNGLAHRGGNGARHSATRAGRTHRARAQ